MRKTTSPALFLAAVLLLSAFGPAARAAETDRTALAKAQDALNAEYGLAKDAKFYFVFDVLGKKMELRVRGMVLRTWPIESMRFWGRPEFSGSVELVKKTALKAPERIVIKPGDTEVITPAPAAKPAAPGAATTSADYDLEALELRDMPRRFSLDLSNGLHIIVKAKSGDAAGFGARLKDAWRWYVGLPLQNLFGPKGEKGLSELELVFVDEKDPQSIYWHLFDGIKGIIQ
jgi:hypothetical protein